MSIKANPMPEGIVDVRVEPVYAFFEDQTPTKTLFTVLCNAGTYVEEVSFIVHNSEVPEPSKANDWLVSKVKALQSA